MATSQDIQTREEKLAWLRHEVEKGVDSPMVVLTPQDMIAELKAELRARVTYRAISFPGLI